MNTSSNLSQGIDASWAIALKRQFNLEQRLTKDPELDDAYRSFMDEYLSLRHMRVPSWPEINFIPHHVVMKNDGDVSKLRVVFDASAKSSYVISFNDSLCTVPKLQTDIGELLLTCRLYKFIFIADTAKMYRQISVRNEDCAYQHILWYQTMRYKSSSYWRPFTGLVHHLFLQLVCYMRWILLPSHVLLLQRES